MPVPGILQHVSDTYLVIMLQIETNFAPQELGHLANKD